MTEESTRTRGVLLVDDEPLVRTGLARKVDWSSYGLRVVAEAANSEEALEKLCSPEINLVITDIKMPGADGIELIRRAHQTRPDVRFVVLSGYDEFDFAKEAMRFGVRHYLLKPTKPSELDRVLHEASRELEELEEERGVRSQVEERLARSLPMIREQFFRDLIAGRLYTRDELGSSLSFLSIPDEPVAFLLFAIPAPVAYEQILTLRWILERTIGEAALLLVATIKDSLAVLTPDRELQGFLRRLAQVRERFHHLAGRALTVALGGSGPISAVGGLYDKAVTCMGYRFHYGDDSLITPDDVVPDADRASTGDIEYHKQRAALAVRCGDRRAFADSVDALMEEMRRRRHPQADVRSHLIELLFTISRGDGYERLGTYLSCAEQLQQAATMDELGRLFLACCTPLLDSNYARLKTKRSLLVEKVVSCVEHNLGDPRLSLKWLAANLVYANVDYLSKAFKRETGENFSHYVTRLRIERARRLLCDSPQLSIAEVACQVGFGDGAQYFSRVFRSYTRITPSQCRRGDPGEA